MFRLGRFQLQLWRNDDWRFWQVLIGRDGIRYGWLSLYFGRVGVFVAVWR